MLNLKSIFIFVIILLAGFAFFYYQYFQEQPPIFSVKQEISEPQNPRLFSVIKPAGESELKIEAATTTKVPFGEVPTAKPSGLFKSAEPKDVVKPENPEMFLNFPEETKSLPKIFPKPSLFQKLFFNSKFLNFKTQLAQLFNVLSFSKPIGYVWNRDDQQWHGPYDQPHNFIKWTGVDVFWDSREELLVLDEDGINAYVWNRGDGQWHGPYRQPIKIRDWTGIDVQGDSKEEIVVLNEFGDKLYVIYDTTGQGQWVWQGPHNIPAKFSTLTALNLGGSSKKELLALDETHQNGYVWHPDTQQWTGPHPQPYKFRDWTGIDAWGNPSDGLPEELVAIAEDGKHSFVWDNNRQQWTGPYGNFGDQNLEFMTWTGVDVFWDSKKDLVALVKELPSPPTCALTFTPNSIIQGEKTTAAWTYTGIITSAPAVCSGDLGNSPNHPTTSGSSVHYPKQSQTCAINVEGPGGKSSCKADITVAPSSEINPDIHWNPNEEGFDSSYYLNKKYKGKIITKELNTEILPYEAHLEKHKYVLNLYLPKEYESGKEYPLAFNVHGCMGNGFQELVSSAPFMFNDKISWLELTDQKDDVITVSLTSEASWLCHDHRSDWSLPPDKTIELYRQLVQKDREAIEESMRYLLANYRIKKEYAFLTGFSGGGNAVHYTGPRTSQFFKYTIARSAIFNPEHHQFVDWQTVKNNNQKYHLLTNPTDGAFEANKNAYNSYSSKGVSVKLDENKGSGHDVLKKEAIELIRKIIGGADPPPPSALILKQRMGLWFADPLALNTKSKMVFRMQMPSGFQPFVESSVGWVWLNAFNRANVDYLTSTNVDILAMIPLIPEGTPMKPGVAPKLHDNLIEYDKFLKETARKYKGKIGQWILIDEPEGEWSWNDSSENYALLLRLVYRAIKSEDPNAKIMLGKGTEAVAYDRNAKVGEISVGRKGFFSDVIKELQYLEELEKAKPTSMPDEFKRKHSTVDEKEFTIIISNDNFNKYFDLAGIMGVKREDFVYFIQVVKNVLYPYAGQIPIWQTDRFMCSSLNPPTFIQEGCDERKQAKEVLDTLTWILTQGTERSVHNTFLTNLDDSKRLVFYSVKKLIEEIGSYNDIQLLSQDTNVYVYKITGKNIKEKYFALWDAEADSSYKKGQTKTITFDVGNLQQVKITKAIPKYKTGKEVKDYNTAFETKTASATNGKITLTLDEEPVYVESAFETAESMQKSETSDKIESFQSQEQSKSKDANGIIKSLKNKIRFFFKEN